LLNLTDDPAAALRYPSICAHASLMSHTTPARRSGRLSRDVVLHWSYVDQVAAAMIACRPRSPMIEL
jgi:hypothetical protein